MTINSFLGVVGHEEIDQAKIIIWFDQATTIIWSDQAKSLFDFHNSATF